MREKRKHKRANLIYYLEVHDEEAKKCIGHLIDISQGGLKLISELKTIPGTEHKIRILLPEDSSHKSIALKAKSCWSQADINPDYMASGLEFIELSEESTKIIKMIINRYKMENYTTNLSNK